MAAPVGGNPPAALDRTVSDPNVLLPPPKTYVVRGVISFSTIPKVNFTADMQSGLKKALASRCGGLSEANVQIEVNPGRRRLLSGVVVAYSVMATSEAEANTAFNTITEVAASAGGIQALVGDIKASATGFATWDMSQTGMSVPVRQYVPIEELLAKARGRSTQAAKNAADAGQVAVDAQNAMMAKLAEAQALARSAQDTHNGGSGVEVQAGMYTAEVASRTATEMRPVVVAKKEAAYSAAKMAQQAEASVKAVETAMRAAGETPPVVPAAGAAPVAVRKAGPPSSLKMTDFDSDDVMLSPTQKAKKDKQASKDGLSALGMKVKKGPCGPVCSCPKAGKCGCSKDPKPNPCDKDAAPAEPDKLSPRQKLLKELGQRLILLSRSKTARREADAKFKYAEKEHKKRQEEKKKKAAEERTKRMLEKMNQLQQQVFTYKTKADQLEKVITAPAMTVEQIRNATLNEIPNCGPNSLLNTTSGKCQSNGGSLNDAAGAAGAAPHKAGVLESLRTEIGDLQEEIKIVGRLHVLPNATIVHRPWPTPEEAGGPAGGFEVTGGADESGAGSSVEDKDKIWTRVGKLEQKKLLARVKELEAKKKKAGKVGEGTLKERIASLEKAALVKRIKKLEKAAKKKSGSKSGSGSGSGSGSEETVDDGKGNKSDEVTDDDGSSSGSASGSGSSSKEYVVPKMVPAKGISGKDTGGPKGGKEPIIVAKLGSAMADTEDKDFLVEADTVPALKEKKKKEAPAPAAPEDKGPPNPLDDQSGNPMGLLGVTSTPSKDKGNGKSVARIIAESIALHHEKVVKKDDGGPIGASGLLTGFLEQSSTVSKAKAKAKHHRHRSGRHHAGHHAKKAATEAKAKVKKAATAAKKGTPVLGAAASIVENAQAGVKHQTPAEVEADAAALASPIPVQSSAAEYAYRSDLISARRANDQRLERQKFIMEREKTKTLKAKGEAAAQMLEYAKDDLKAKAQGVQKAKKELALDKHTLLGVLGDLQKNPADANLEGAKKRLEAAIRTRKDVHAVAVADYKSSWDGLQKKRASVAELQKAALEAAARESKAEESLQVSIMKQSRADMTAAEARLNVKSLAEQRILTESALRMGEGRPRPLAPTTTTTTPTPTTTTRAEPIDPSDCIPDERGVISSRCPVCTPGTDGVLPANCARPSPLDFDMGKGAGGSDSKPVTLRDHTVPVDLPGVAIDASPSAKALAVKDGRLAAATVRQAQRMANEGVAINRVAGAIKAVTDGKETPLEVALRRNDVKNVNMADKSAVLAIEPEADRLGNAIGANKLNTRIPTDTSDLPYDKSNADVNKVTADPNAEASVMAPSGRYSFLEQGQGHGQAAAPVLGDITEAVERKAAAMGASLEQKQLRDSVKSRDAALEKMSANSLDEAHAIRMHAMQVMYGQAASAGVVAPVKTSARKYGVDFADEISRLKVAPNKGLAEPVVGGQGVGAAARKHSQSLFDDLPVVKDDPLFEHTRQWLQSSHPKPGRIANAEAASLVEVRESRRKAERELCGSVGGVNAENAGKGR